MSCLRLRVVCGLLVAIGGCTYFSGPARAQSQAMPTMAAPPQQMRANEAPASYPVTSYPATASPPTGSVTSYPATAPSTSSPATPYPTTAATSGSTAGSYGRPDYRTTLPGIDASPRVAQANPWTDGYDYSAAPAYAPYGSSDPLDGTMPMEAGSLVERSLRSNEPWTWQMLPTGLMYRSYLAGLREPRLGTQFIHERNLHWRWDSTLGGRVGIFRYGTEDALLPQGFQLDFEGAAFPRLNLQTQRDLDDVDFRAGALLTTRQGPAELKFGYYHYCSHIGDEYLIANPDFVRSNYVRETLVLGGAVYLNSFTRLYSEAGYAPYTDGGAGPWDLQFGIECSSLEPGSAPFFAVNGHLHQETDFSGNVNMQTGWQWRGRTGHLFRVGLQYFNGLSEHAQFYNTFEEQIGVGLWYDF